MDFNALDISASALHAQRVKMDTIASNIANVNTTRGPDGSPSVYRRKETVFSTIYNDNLKQQTDSNTSNQTSSEKSGESASVGLISGGVKVFEIKEDHNTPIKKVYNPAHPDADEKGYVNLPNVNIVTEMVDMISASRAYEANVTTINATKQMISAALKI